MIGLIFALQMVRAGASDVPPAGLCDLLLSTQSKFGGPLDPALMDELIRTIPVERLNTPTRFAAEIHAVVDELVTSGQIDEGLAQNLFTERTLVQFLPIFRRFMVAELRARDFKDEALIDFVLNFDVAFTPEAQIEFTLAVARRMLVIINDDTSVQSERGINQFNDMVAALRVDRRVYGQFLRAWSVLRAAPARAAVRFFLAHVRYAAREVAAAPDLPAPAAPPTGLRAWLTPVRPKAPDPSIRAVARARLDDLVVPEVLKSTGAFGEVGEPESIVDRLLGLFRPLGDFAERLELTPPFAWNYLVTNEIGRLDPRQLRALIKSRVYRKLGPEARAAVDGLFDTFDRLERSAADIIRQSREDGLKSRGTGSSQPANETAVNTFVKHFTSEVESVGPFFKTRDTYINAVGEALRCARRAHPAFSSADYRDGSLSIFKYVTENAPMAEVIATGLSLSVSSRGLDMVDEDVQAILATIELYRYNSSALRQYTAALPIFDRKKWGRPPLDRAKKVPASPGLSDKMIVLLDAFRAELPPDEARSLTNEDLYLLIINSPRNADREI